MDRSGDDPGSARRQVAAGGADGVRNTITDSTAHVVIQARDIGGDVNVTLFAERDPGYRLVDFPSTGQDVAPAVDGRGLPAQPSHLLDARFAVVDFTARDAEVRELAAWAQGGDRAVRWLHAPGGQGKTRLAGHVGGLAARAGWKVVTAEPTAGRIAVAAPSTPDPKPGAAAGLLLLVDYADRWPLDHLTSLLGDKALYRDVPVRVLLLARTAHVWPVLRHALTQAGWPPDACTSRGLEPLPVADSARDRMFTAARDCFARHYRVADPEAIGVPDWLGRDEFGLTLAVHMAALVAVDRHVRTADRPAAPEDLTGLTGYLLDRERHHWHTMHDRGWATSPDVMSRAVFVAALTGPLAYRDARTVLDTVGLGDVDRVLTDHARCYPPADRRTVLEPLYPDRLAEDFLALCLTGDNLPGDDLTGHGLSDPWADGVPALLLAPPAGGDAPPPHAARTITFLTAASERRPHLIDTLEAFDAQVPEDTVGALTVAAADLAERLARHRLATADDPAERARVHAHLGGRLVAADRQAKAEAAFREAVRLYRPLAEADPAEFEHRLAETLALLGATLLAQGLDTEWWTNSVNLSIRGSRWAPSERQEEALAVLTEARRIYGRLAREDPAEHEGGFATMTAAVSTALVRLERWEEADANAVEGIELFRRLARVDPAGHEVSLVAWLDLRTTILRELDRREEALVTAREVVDSYRRMARVDRAEHEPRLRSALEGLAWALSDLGRADESLAAIGEAMRMSRRLARENPAEHREGLLSTVERQVQVLLDLGRSDEALPASVEAVELCRRLAEEDPARYEERFAGTLANLSLALQERKRWAEVPPIAGEALDIRRRLARDNPAEHEHILSIELFLLARVLAALGRWDEALVLAAEGADITYRMRGDGGACVERDLTTGAVTLARQVMDGEGETGYPRRAFSAGFDGALAEVVEGFAEANAVPGRDSEALAGYVVALEAARRRLVHDGQVSALHLRVTGSDPLDAGRSLADLRVLLGTDLPDSLRAAVDALDRLVAEHRRSTRRDFDRHAPALGVVLTGQALLLWSWGRHEEALSPVCEAVEVYGRLARHVDARHEPVLATAWARAAVVLAELGHVITSVAAMDRSIDVRRRLVRHDPAGHEPVLAVDLALRGRTLAKAGEWDDALTSLVESFDIRRRLGESVPDSLTAATDFLATHLSGPELGPGHVTALDYAVARRRTASGDTDVPEGTASPEW